MEQKVTPHRGARTRRRGEQGGGACRNEGTYPPELTTNQERRGRRSYGKKRGRKTDKREGKETEGSLPPGTTTHTLPSAGLRPYLRPSAFPPRSVRLVLWPHCQRRFDARLDFVVVAKSGPFDLRPTLAFPSPCADQTILSARLGT